MNTTRPTFCVLLLLATLAMSAAAAKEERFQVTQVLVEGNTLLPDAQLTELLAPLMGSGRLVGDVLRTRAALENAYRTAGFAGVTVSVPEQKLLGGAVRLQVAENARDDAGTGNGPATGRAGLPILTADAAPGLIRSAELSTPIPQAPEFPGAAPVAELAAAAEETTDERFRIKQFLIEGNTLLPAERLASLVTPFTGDRKVYGDIQRALEAVESAYRAEGYNTVQVYVPEQELTQGEVKLQVTEGVIGKVVVSGNKYFSTENVRDGLPALKEGVAPNARLLSKNIQLSNDNAAKQVEVTLGVSEEEGKIDAKVAVTEEDPLKLSLTLDNTGSGATGKHRAGFAYQHANLFDFDHTLTLAYTTSPDAPKGVKVNIFSLAYRMPLYGLGDSLDMIYGKSSVNTPSVQATGFGLTGKGDVLALRFNHYFARRGEYSAKLAFGLDYKYFNTRCSINGVPQSFEPPLAAIASCTPHTSRPVSVTYSGQKQGAASLLDYNLGLAYNLPLGYNYLSNGRFDRYSFIAGRPVSDHFSILRYGINYLTVMFTDWQIKAALSGQYTSNGLIAGEQFGLAGSNAVRGFAERAIAADTGELVNIEAYSPELAKGLGLPGSLRGVLFFDVSHGRNIGVEVPTPTTADSLGVAAAGFGLRYNLGKDMSVRADVAQVTKAGPIGTEGRGDWRGHFNMLFNF